MAQNELTGAQKNTEEQKSWTNTPLTQDALDEAVGKLNSTLARLGRPLWAAVSLVIIVLLVGFVSVLLTSYALVVDSNNSKTASYEQLNAKIDLLLTKLK